MPKKEVNKNTVLDRMRFVKDKTPSNLALVSIVFDVLYFVVIYRINKEYFYTLMMGVSIVTNLFYMLLAFLCSEEVKNYHGKFGYLMIALGIVQIVRIFIYPLSATNATALVAGEMNQVMESATFVKCCVYLCGSAAVMIVGGLISIKNSKTLENYMATLEKK